MWLFLKERWASKPWLGFLLIFFGYSSLIWIWPQPRSAPEAILKRKRVVPPIADAQPPAKPALPIRYSDTFYLKRGKTLLGMLESVGVQKKTALKVSQALADHLSLRGLSDNQAFILQWKSAEKKELQSLSVQAFFDKKVVVTKAKEDEKWHAHALHQKLVKKWCVFSGTIRESFYKDAQQAGIHRSMVVPLSFLLDRALDASRYVRSGDPFSAFIQEEYNPETGQKRQQYCQKLQIQLKKKSYSFYYYRPKGGRPGFFNVDGALIQGDVFQSPIEGAPVSSRFGYRIHPIKKLRIFHKGVDLLAVKGTPIMAAWSGKILQARVNGGYGNYVLIDHKRGYKTVYAHLSRYAKVARPGNHVKQGQVIGFVGATGNTTGPHLHFEIRKNNIPINPMRVRRKVRFTLKGKEREKFSTYISQVDQAVVCEKKRLLTKKLHTQASMKEPSTGSIAN